MLFNSPVTSTSEATGPAPAPLLPETLGSTKRPTEDASTDLKRNLESKIRNDNTKRKETNKFVVLD